MNHSNSSSSATQPSQRSTSSTPATGAASSSSLAATSRSAASHRSTSSSSSSSTPAKRDRQTRIEFNTPHDLTSDAKRRKPTHTDQHQPRQQEEMEIDQDSSASAGAVVASSPAASTVAPSTARRRAHSPPSRKKLQIKPFKVRPTLAVNFESDILTQLTAAVTAVYSKQHISMSQEELYRSVEALCIHGKAPTVYEKLVAWGTEHVTRMIQTLDEQLSKEDQQQQQQQQQQSSASSSSSTSTSSLSLPFLQQVQSTWLAHCDEMLIIRGIFLYLDRTYVIQLAATHNNNSDDANQSAPKSLWDMGLGLFGQQLKKYSNVEQRIVSGLLALIERERNGESVNRSLIKSLVRMLTALKLYSITFQPIFLSTTAAYYAAESKRNISTSTPTEYIHYIQMRLQQEEDRTQSYLDESTRAPLIALMQQQLIQAHSTHMLDIGFNQLLDQKRSVELGIMYKLFERIRALDQLRTSFGSYVKQTAGGIVKTGSIEPSESGSDTTTSSAAAPMETETPAGSPQPAAGSIISTPATMIMDLLKLKVTLDDVLSHSFASNADFLGALKSGITHALNSVENKPAEFIAKFLDKVLRTGGKGMKIANTSTIDTTTSDALASSSSISAVAASSSSISAGGGDDVETLLDQVLFLFRYINGKDVFQAFYKKDLAKRLLLQKSASIDLEKSMLSKIKNECGPSFTTKLEGMFKDIDLSKETQIEYEQHRAQHTKASGASSASSSSAVAASSSGMELSVQVLTTGNWPAYTPLELTLPREVASMHDDFKLFYLNKHSGHKLIWHHSLAGAVLRGHFTKARKELAVSGVQAVVLMLFNDHIRLSMEEIGKYGGITDTNELKKTLASLTFADDTRILIKEPRNKKLLPSDIFRVNTDFTHKLFRVKINAMQMKETKEEQKTTTTRVFEDRQYALDALLVRIMKARKTLSHQLLIMECMQQIKFPTKPADIKKRIGSLIEREYMERDKNDSSVYNYMA